MFYKFHLLRENLIVHDEYYFSEIEPPRGKNCFLIVHHTKRKRSIVQVLTRLLEQGYTYFYFWGEYAFSWKSNLEKMLRNRKANNKGESASKFRYEAGILNISQDFKVPVDEAEYFMKIFDKNQGAKDRESFNYLFKKVDLDTYKEEHDLSNMLKAKQHYRENMALKVAEDVAPYDVMQLIENINGTINI